MKQLVNHRRRLKIWCGCGALSLGLIWVAPLSGQAADPWAKCKEDYDFCKLKAAAAKEKAEDGCGRRFGTRDSVFDAEKLSQCEDQSREAFELAFQHCKTGYDRCADRVIAEQAAKSRPAGPEEKARADEKKEALERALQLPKLSQPGQGAAAPPSEPPAAAESGSAAPAEKKKAPLEDNRVMPGFHQFGYIPPPTD